MNAKDTILAVDDSPEILDVLNGILVPQYVMKVAISGAMALEVATMQPPDLILLDIKMPIMDGYETCRQLKINSATENIPVIFLTSQDAFMDEAKGLMLGAVDFLMKPIEPKLLLTRIRVQLSQFARWKDREENLLSRIAILETELAELRGK